jgi:hypothetical protein
MCSKLWYEEVTQAVARFLPPGNVAAACTIVGVLLIGRDLVLPLQASLKFDENNKHSAMEKAYPTA